MKKIVWITFMMISIISFSPVSKAFDLLDVQSLGENDKGFKLLWTGIAECDASAVKSNINKKNYNKVLNQELDLGKERYITSIEMGLFGFMRGDCDEKSLMDTTKILLTQGIKPPAPQSKAGGGLYMISGDALFETPTDEKIKMGIYKYFALLKEYGAEYDLSKAHIEAVNKITIEKVRYTAVITNERNLVTFLEAGYADSKSYPKRLSDVQYYHLMEGIKVLEYTTNGKEFQLTLVLDEHPNIGYTYNSNIGSFDKITP